MFRDLQENGNGACVVVGARRAGYGVIVRSQDNDLARGRIPFLLSDNIVERPPFPLEGFLPNLQPGLLEFAINVLPRPFQRLTLFHGTAIEVDLFNVFLQANARNRLHHRRDLFVSCLQDNHDQEG